MTPHTKRIILITGATLVLVAIGFGVYLYFKKKAEDQADNTDDSSSKKSGGNIFHTSGGTTNSTTKPKDDPKPEPAPPPTDPNKVVPKFNSERELTNPYSQLKDHVLYPKRKEMKGSGYANIRSSAEVNTDQGWWDMKDNLITTINSGIPIGKVIGETSGLFNGYSYRWFKVKLTKPIGFWSKTYEGFVRSDTVTFIAYDK